MLRTHTCGELNKSHIREEVTLCGWVSTIRDHGGVLFIDLRDRYGITQIVFNPQKNKEIHKQAEKLGSEYVIKIKGRIQARPEGTANKGIPTGEIEIPADELNILNPSKPPLFEITDSTNLSEDLRYKYRYLDLRRPVMQKNILIRHRIFKMTRDYMDDNGFIEAETPILTKSTPEGARDYLVPSRIDPGKFFALPQSPQLFKQILMVGGLDKYFQIVKCFRDEDLRADRQPEFTQLDLEMSFIKEDDIYALIESLIAKIFKKILSIDIKTPFTRMVHKDALERFGTDKPDTRFAMELIDLTEELRKCEFKVFKNAAEKGVIKAINLKAPKDASRRRIDSMIEYVKSIGGKGLAYFTVSGGKLSGSLAKFFNEKFSKAILDKCDAKDGDLLLFVADEKQTANFILDDLRRKLAREEGVIDKNTFNFLWITEFPLFVYNDEEKRWQSEHHPFTSPFEQDIKNMSKEPQKARARSYDLVVNGVEIGSGSIRIHDHELQKSIFNIINISDEEVEKRFGFLIKAFKFGAPPHGGIALGLDRLIAIMLGCSSIRDVIVFPKTQRATCMLTDAPSDVSDKQLKELGISLKSSKSLKG